MIACEFETSGYNYLFCFYILDAVIHTRMLSNVRLLATTNCSAFTLSML